jgi:hypothetical protein
MAYILAAAQVKQGALYSSSADVTWANGKLSFPNPERLKFVPVISDSQDAPYITATHWIRQIGPDYIVVLLKALDTGSATTRAAKPLVPISPAWRRRGPVGVIRPAFSPIDDALQAGAHRLANVRR